MDMLQKIVSAKSTSYREPHFHIEVMGRVGLDLIALLVTEGKCGKISQSMDVRIGSSTSGGYSHLYQNVISMMEVSVFS